MSFSFIPSRREARFADFSFPTQAGKYAHEFNERKVPKAVEFIAAYVIELIDRPDRPMCGVERYVPGECVPLPMPIPFRFTSVPFI